MVNPDDRGSSRVRIGDVEEGSKEDEDTETHLTGEGVAGAGGKVAGLRVFWVAFKTFGESSGGMTKWRLPSLFLKMSHGYAEVKCNFTLTPRQRSN